MAVASSPENESFSGVIPHLNCLRQGKYNARIFSEITFFVVFRVEVLFISFNEFVVLVTLPCHFGYSHVPFASVSHLNFHGVLFGVQRSLN